MALTSSQLAMCALIFTGGVVSGPVIQKEAHKIVAKGVKKPAKRVSQKKATEVAKKEECVPVVINLPGPLSGVGDPVYDLGGFTFDGFRPDTVSPSSRKERLTYGWPLRPVDPPIVDIVPDIPSNVPEPSSWAMLIAGFGLIGFSIRKKKTNQGVNPL